MQLRQLTLIAFFTALLALLAQISIPLPFTPVPITGQTLGIFLVIFFFGGRQAFLAVLAYLLLGAAGAPVFAAGRGGLPVLLGPTGGYLLGFLPGVYLGGRLLQGRPKPGRGRTAAALLTCLFAYYIAGALQLGLIMRLDAARTILAGVIPYIFPDLAKAGLAAALAPALRAALAKPGLFNRSQDRFP